MLIEAPFVTQRVTISAEYEAVVEILKEQRTLSSHMTKTKSYCPDLVGSGHSEAPHT